MSIVLLQFEVTQYSPIIVAVELALTALKRKVTIRKNLKDFKEYALANDQLFNIFDVFDEIKSKMKKKVCRN